MNKERRKNIDDIIERLKVAKELILVLVEEEQESFYNFPYYLQYTIRAELMQDAIDNLHYARVSIDPVIDYLEEAKNS